MTSIYYCGTLNNPVVGDRFADRLQLPPEARYSLPAGLEAIRAIPNKQKPAVTNEGDDGARDARR